MERFKGMIEEDRVPFDGLRCTSCGEEILTMSQLKILAKSYRKLRKGKNVTFASWGTSVAVRIPKEVAEHYHIQSGCKGILTKESAGFRIIPLQEAKPFNRGHHS
jgi:hypothetical protein